MPKAKVLTDEQIYTAIGEMINRHVSQLSEHLDSVQIVGTKLGPNGQTQAFMTGSGDIFARVKAAERFVEASGV